MLLKDKFWSRRQAKIDLYSVPIPEANIEIPELISYINKEAMNKRVEKLKKIVGTTDLRKGADHFFSKRIVRDKDINGEKFVE